jgi:hypothetical protein
MGKYGKKSHPVAIFTKTSITINKLPIMPGPLGRETRFPAEGFGRERQGKC